MHRRGFIKGSAVTGAVTAMGGRSYAVPPGWRQFEVTYRITLKDASGPARLWVPVPQDAQDYQRVVDLGWRSPVSTRLLWEGTSRAPIVTAAWLD